MNDMTDYDTMISVFDEAINSDDTRVRQALNSLVMLVQLTRDTDNPARQGPLAEMQSKLADMQQELKNYKKRWDMAHMPDVKSEWANIYKQKMYNKITGHTVNQVWMDEVDTVHHVWEDYLKKDTKA